MSWGFHQGGVLTLVTWLKFRLKFWRARGSTVFSVCNRSRRFPGRELLLPSGILSRSFSQQLQSGCGSALEEPFKDRLKRYIEEKLPL